MAIQLPDSPSIVIEICLQEKGYPPVSFYTGTIRQGQPPWPSAEQEMANLAEYGRVLAMRGDITKKRLDPQEVSQSETLDGTIAGHYILNIDREVRVLVVVAGPPTDICRMYARFAAAGIALAAKQVK